MSFLDLVLGPQCSPLQPAPLVLTRFELGSHLSTSPSSRPGPGTKIYHGLALLAVSWAVSRWPGSLPVYAGWLFVLGSVVFSGSLYILALTGVRWWGAVTPIGGVAFLAGWLCLVLTAVRR